jgi:UPF0755 protein
MSRKKRKSSGRKAVLAIVIVLLGIAGFLALKTFGPATDINGDKHYFYIRTGSDYNAVLKDIQDQGILSSTIFFDFLAQRANYPSRVKAGKYRIDKGMSNFQIIRMLRAGRQEPVKLVINKLRTKQDFISFLGSQLEADSNDVRRLLQDSVFLSQYGLNADNAMAIVIPDTYELWWNTGAPKVMNKLGGYYTQFWTAARKEKAEKQGLSLPQIATVASIVDEETNNNPEKPNIASVYINRYRKGMRLQADPTVKFAIGDFTIRRVTGAHTAFASPYNTYYTAGLPPGPICTPSKKSVDAVLNAPQTDYIYFCAKEDFSGTHRFAASYAEHMKNARLYQQALNARGIR